MQPLRASPVFAIIVLVTLALSGLIGVMLAGGQFGLEAVASMGHFSSPDHRTHELTYAFLFGVGAIGMVAQLRAPSKNVAGQLMALVPWVGFVLAYAFGNITINLLRPPFVPIFGALALIATILHPTWRGLFSSFSASKVSWLMLTLVIIAAAPLLILATTNTGLQRTATDGHAALSHYGYMAAFSFTIIGVGILASLRPDGWWVPAWIAGLLPVLLGLISLLAPDNTGSLSLIRALAAIVWGVVFIVVAEITQNAKNPTLLGSRRITSEDDIRVSPDSRPTANTPRWVKVFGVIALVPILLIVINMVAGVVSGGVDSHTPSNADTPPVEQGSQPGNASGHTPPIRHGP